MPSGERLLAETYDEANATVRNPSGDRAFYATLADEVGGPVLEIGCGTGRVLAPIAAAGHEVLGVDPSPEMLAVPVESWLQRRSQDLSGRLD